MQLGPTHFRGLRDQIVFLITVLSTGFVKKWDLYHEEILFLENLFLD